MPQAGDDVIALKPAVGLTLPWAGLSPAPSIRKRKYQMRGCALVRTFGAEARASDSYLARYTGEVAGGRSRG